MLVEYFKTLYDYTYWANTTIRETAEQVSEAQFIDKILESHESLHRTLVHMLSAEWLWRSRWQGTSPTEHLPAEDLPTLAALRQRWHDEEQQMRLFLAGLRDEDLHRVVHYTNMQGKAYAFPLWQLMQQVVNHGTQHRSEAALMLSHIGYSPGDLDWLVFFSR